MLSILSLTIHVIISSSAAAFVLFHFINLDFKIALQQCSDKIDNDIDIDSCEGRMMIT